SATELADSLLHELRESVSRQLVADVPVGVFLSGGVASSGIVALARESGAASTLKSYSIGYEGAAEYDELRFASQIARQFGTNHIERVVKPSEVSEFIPKMVQIYDEPLADATSIPFHFISKLAQENGSTVVLTGDGADELFCGYRRWSSYAKVLPWYYRYMKTPQWLRRGIRGLYGKLDHS